MLTDIRAIFFDWGQTLVGVAREKFAYVEGAENTTRLLFAAGSAAPDSATQDLLDLIHAAIQRTAQPPDYAEVDSGRVLTAWLKKLKVPKPDPELIAQLIDRFWSCWIGCLDVLPDVAQALATLQHRGYRLALVSNVSAPPEYCQRQLEHLDLAGYLDATVFSSAVGRRKPHPAMYRAALDALADTAPPVEPQHILFVGDSPLSDVIAPMELAMHAALIKNDQTDWPAHAYHQANPDLTITHLAQLLDHLPQRR